MKLKLLQKRVAVRLGIAFGVLVVLGGGVAVVATVNNGYLQDQAKLKSQLDGLNARSRDLQNKMVSAKESLELYEAIQNRGTSSALTIDRDDAKRRLDKMKDRYQLNSLTLTMTPIANAPGGSDVQLVSTDAKLTVSALTDEIILSFLNGIKLEFPGFVRIQRFEMVRKDDLTREVLIDITHGKFASLVEAEIDFKWLGMKAPDIKGGNPQNPAAPQPAPQAAP